MYRINYIDHTFITSNSMSSHIIRLQEVETKMAIIFVLQEVINNVVDTYKSSWSLNNKHNAFWNGVEISHLELQCYPGLLSFWKPTKWFGLLHSFAVLDVYNVTSQLYWTFIVKNDISQRDKFCGQFYLLCCMSTKEKHFRLNEMKHKV